MQKSLRHLNLIFVGTRKVPFVSLFTSNYECTPLYLQNLNTPPSLYFSPLLSLLLNNRDLSLSLSFSMSLFLSLSMSPIMTLLLRYEGPTELEKISDGITLTSQHIARYFKGITQSEFSGNYKKLTVKIIALTCVKRQKKIKIPMF